MNPNFYVHPILYWELGRIYRDEIISQIKIFAYQFDVDFDYLEDRKLLSSIYVIKIKGDYNQVNLFLDLIKNYLDRIQQFG